MDPFLDYYLCTRNGVTNLVAAVLGGDGALEGYETVHKLAYWQALQWNAALWVVERSSEENDQLRSLLSAAFLEARGGAIGNSFPVGNGLRGLA